MTTGNGKISAETAILSFQAVGRCRNLLHGHTFIELVVGTNLRFIVRILILPVIVLYHSRLSIVSFQLAVIKNPKFADKFSDMGSRKVAISGHEVAVSPKRCM